METDSISAAILSGNTVFLSVP